MKVDDTHKKVEYGKPEHFKRKAHVSMIIEPIQHLDTQPENKKTMTSSVLQMYRKCGIIVAQGRKVNLCDPKFKN